MLKWPGNDSKGKGSRSLKEEKCISFLVVSSLANSSLLTSSVDLYVRRSLWCLFQ